MGRWLGIVGGRVACGCEGHDNEAQC